MFFATGESGDVMFCIYLTMVGFFTAVKTREFGFADYAEFNNFTTALWDSILCLLRSFPS